MAEPSAEEQEAALEEHPEWSGLAVVDEDQHRHPRLFLQTVPEPKVGANRVRPVLAIDQVERLLQLGAQETGAGLLADVEGNEFRVETAPGSDPCFVAVEIDAEDPGRQAQFWAEMLGFGREGTTCHPPPAWRARVAQFPSFTFVASSGPKERKNRIHFDFLCGGEDDDHGRLLDMGARVVTHGNGFVTMQDLEGNEFDLSTPR